MESTRGRWKYNEETDEFEPVVHKGKPPTPAETDEDRKKREQAERDEHPGNYI